MCTKEEVATLLGHMQEYGNTEDSIPEALWGVSNEEVAAYILKHSTVFPCTIGERFWRIVYPYQEMPKVIEVEVINFRTFGAEHTPQVEVRPTDVDEPNWMYYNWANYDDLFKNKYDADAKLSEFLNRGE